MGLFTPKISPKELEYVRTRMSQLQDTVHLINTTTKPDVFFKRLNFALDILLDLQRYEKYRIFTNAKPSQDYQKIIQNMEHTVDNFIDRVLDANEQKIATLKTPSAKQRNREKSIIALISAFDCAHTFWEGSKGFPHYSGPLFTKNNYTRVQEIYDSLDD